MNKINILQYNYMGSRLIHMKIYTKKLISKKKGFKEGLET